MTHEASKPHNFLLLLSLAVNVAAALYFVMGVSRIDLRTCATETELSMLSPPALGNAASSSTHLAAEVDPYAHLDSSKLQTPAMRKAMMENCPLDRRIDTISDSTSYNEFIIKVFDSLNKVTTRKERALFWVLDRFEEVWGNSMSQGRGALPGGFYSEFGVFSGATLTYAHQRLKQPEPAPRLTGPIAGFDSFEGLPEKWRGGFEAGRFGSRGLYEQVRALVNPEVELHKGWFQQTIDKFLAAHPRTPASLIHHDGDLFISTTITFSMLDRRIVPGTIICFDELHSYPGWEKHEMLSFYLWMIQSKAKMCAISTKEPIHYNITEGGVVKQIMAGELHAYQQSSCFQVLDR